MTALAETPVLPAFVHGQPPEETNEGFRIDDDRKAAWAAGKILAARHRIANRTSLAEAYQGRILDWLTRANMVDQQTLSYLEASLRPWVEEAISHLGKVKSLSLPGAKVGLRKKPDRVEIADLDSAMAFCLEHLEEVVVVRRDLAKTELKRHLAAGARIPGAELVPGTEELTVTEDSKGELS